MRIVSFLEFFVSIIKTFKYDIVGLLETKVSGSKTNRVIAKLGFQFSHLIEAIDFSGGI